MIPYRPVNSRIRSGPEVNATVHSCHADNLLRRQKATPNVLSERSTNRPKEPSTAFLRRAGARSTSGTHLRRPSRQPLDPPQGAFAQSDSGFDRFLKEHSSPKHQRVTAGGRIVPMKQLTPPPKMKLPINQQGTSCNAQPHDEPKIKPLEKVPSQDMDVDSNTNNYPNSSSLPSATLMDYAKLLAGNGNFGPQFQVPGLFANIPSGSITPAMILQPHIPLNSGGQHFLQPEQRSIDYLPVIPNCAAYGIGADQVALLPNVNQGLNYPNATVPFMASQTNSSASVSPSEFSTGSNLSGLASAFGSMSSGFDPFYQPIGLPGQQVSTHQAPVFNQPVSFSDVPQEVSPWKALQEAIKEHAALSAQLSRLDRYTAVHTWDLDPQKKRTAVEQRMSLVRELDAVRTYKEQLESLYGQVQPSTSTKAQAPSTRRTPGNLANKGASLPTRAADSTAPHAIPAQPAAKPANVTSTVRSVHQRSIPAQKRQQPEKEHLLNVSNRSKDMWTNRGPSCENKSPHRGQSLNSNLSPGKRDIQSGTTDRSNLAEAIGDTDGWAIPAQSAPPDIRRLYCKIEEAIRRGAPIDRFLQELTTVTTRLPARSNEDNRSVLRPPSKMGQESSEGKIRAASGTTRGFPKDLDGSLRSAKLAAGIQWASEVQPRPHAELASFETDEDDEDDDGSWSSYESTADSWDTVQEGE